MAVNRKSISYSVQVVIDKGSPEDALKNGDVYGVNSGIGGALDVEYYDANDGDAQVVDIVKGLSKYYYGAVANIKLSATYSLGGVSDGD